MGSVDYGELAANASKGFEPLPIGPYDVEVTGAEFKKNGSGNDMYKVEFTIINGPNKGQKIWNNQSLTPSSPGAVGIFFRQMTALGLDTEFFGSINGLEDDEQHGAICQALIGKQATVKVEHRDWNGQTQNDVKSISALAGSSVPNVSAVPATPAAPSAAPDLPPGL